jgi:hypothetical protein
MPSPQGGVFPMSRILIAALLLLTGTASVQGAKDIEFNVDFFCGWENYYRPMEWTPVEIGIGAIKEPFSGTFTITARQDGLNTMNVIHNFVLTPDRPLSAPLVTKFAFAADRCTLAIRDEKGRTRWQQAINPWDLPGQNRMLRAVQDQDMLIGLVGQARFGLLRLSQETACTSDRGQGKVFLGSKVPRAMPWDWTGYVSLDLLVICDLDWSLLQPQQARAICEWISNGGTALLVLGQHPLPAASPLRAFLPFDIGEPKQVQIPSQVLEEWGLDASKAQTVTAWPLSPKRQAVIAAKVETSDGDCLWGAGFAGFGRIAVLAFSPGQLSEEQSGHSAAFWTRQIAAGSESRLPAAPNRANAGLPTGAPPAGGRRIILAEQSSQAGGSGFNPNDNRYQITVAQKATNQVMEFLYQLEQMKPLSIWWIVLTLMALAVLLGPVDYLVLKRFDKLPYTWVTSTGWIVVFTVGAYFGVQWLRGGAMEVRAVSVLDGIADSNCAWATSYTSLFAPRSGDYRLAGLTPNQWWSGISPMREEVWAFQHDSGMQQIHCLQVDGGNLPVSLPINMWTVQPLLSEWPLGRMPFTASVEHGAGTATVEITNASDSAIQRGYVLFADACADLGSVPVHSTRQFHARTRPFRSWEQMGPRPASIRRGQPTIMMPGTSTPRYPGGLGGPAESAFLAQGCLSRTLAMHACLNSGAALVCVVFDKAPLPVEVKDRSYTVNHIQVARQLVLPNRVK